MKKKYLEVGQIVSVHGIKGEVKIYPWCDSAEFITEFDELYVDNGASVVELEGARVHKNMVVTRIKGVSTVEQAQAMRNTVLYIDRDEVELEEGDYFIQDLIGLKVIDADDNSIEYGELVDVTQTGANDVYHVKFEDGTVKLAPAIKSVVISTDIDKGVMEMRPIRGMFDDDYIDERKE